MDTPTAWAGYAHSQLTYCFKKKKPPYLGRLFACYKRVINVVSLRSKRIREIRFICGLAVFFEGALQVVYDAHEVGAFDVVALNHVHQFAVFEEADAGR